MRDSASTPPCCWASAHRFCVAQPCPRLHEACHLQRVTALRGGQKGVSHGAAFWRARRGGGRGADTLTQSFVHCAKHEYVCLEYWVRHTHLTTLLKTGRAHSSTLRSSQVPHEPAHTWCMKLGLDSHSPASACARYGAGGR